MSIWTIFDDITAAAESKQGNMVDPKVDGLLAALAETIADVLPTASQAVLREGAKAAGRALNTVTGFDRASADFVAGQIAAATDVLGFAAGRAADDDALTLAHRGAHAAVLSLLFSGACSNAQIRRALGGRSEEYVCRLLRELRDADLVTTERRGREAFNTLTPIGRLVVETSQKAAETQSARIPPVTRVVPQSYELTLLQAANDIGGGSELPRLNVVAA